MHPRLTQNVLAAGGCGAAPELRAASRTGNTAAWSGRGASVVIFTRIESVAFRGVEVVSSVRMMIQRTPIIASIVFCLAFPIARAQAETHAGEAVADGGGTIEAERAASAQPPAGVLSSVDAGSAQAIESSAPQIAPGRAHLELPHVRLTAAEPPTQAELDALESIRNEECDLRWGLLFPGVGSYCAGRTREGQVLLNAGALELGTGLAMGLNNGFSSASATVPLLGFADLWTAAALDDGLRIARARRLPYTPTESLAEDFSAPFRPDVLRQPEVWAGIIGTVGLGIAYEQFLDGGLATQSAGQRPRLFGKNVNSAIAYPSATLIGVGLFSQVAVAEELAFRGTLQSALARKYGEIPGWIAGSLIFGLFHATNALFLAPNQRVDYITRGVPFITLVGSYLGWTYMDSHYSLAPSIAVHFWYDFLIEATAFVLDPKNSPLAFSYAF